MSDPSFDSPTPQRRDLPPFPSEWMIRADRRGKGRFFALRSRFSQRRSEPLFKLSWLGQLAAGMLAWTLVMGALTSFYIRLRDTHDPRFALAMDIVGCLFPGLIVLAIHAQWRWRWPFFWLGLGVGLLLTCLIVGSDPF